MGVVDYFLSSFAQQVKAGAVAVGNKVYFWVEDVKHFFEKSFAIPEVELVQGEGHRKVDRTAFKGVVFEETTYTLGGLTKLLTGGALNREAKGIA